MKLTKYLISTFLLIIISAQQQSVEAKNVYSQDDTSFEQLYGTNALVETEHELRDIKDIWAKIKESAINTWNYVKLVAEKTKEKIKKIVENIKKQANDLKKKLEIKLENLKNRLNVIISDLYGTGELVKQCVKTERENIDAVLTNIMRQMGVCIAEEIISLNRVDLEHSMNETKFINALNDKFESCERDMQNVQVCLCKVREDIFDNLTDAESEILKMHFEARSLVEDVKEALVTCSLNNLVDATNLISAEMVEIAKCVLKAKEEAKEDTKEEKESANTI